MPATRHFILLVVFALALSARGEEAPHDPDRRISALERLIARSPEDGRLYLRRGELYFQRGDLSRAMADFDRAGELDDALDEVHLARAQIHLHGGVAERGLAEVRRFLDTDPRHGWGQLTRARILSRLDRGEEAAAAYELAVGLLPPRPQYFLERARAQANVGRLATALDGLDQGMAELGPIVSLLDMAIELEVRRDRYEAALDRLATRAEVMASALAPPVPARSRGSDTEFSTMISAISAVASPRSPATTLVPRGSPWRYLDDGTDLGNTWRGLRFVDFRWNLGPAELGYGDGDEATLVGFGPDAAQKHITTYFRHRFWVADATAYLGATLGLMRDDGAVVYLNGIEVARTNMPSEVDYLTPGLLPSVGSDEKLFRSFPVDASLLITGSNVLAVEVHQQAAISADMSFDLELIASSSEEVVRGPYLQRGTPTSAVLRWQTNTATASVVWTGAAPDNLSLEAVNAAATREHEVLLTGLSPDTRYYYAVGSGAGFLAGGDPDHSFTTPPALGTGRNTRIWAIGDSGTANEDAAAVRDAYLALADDRPTDVWLMLGDNAYNGGEDSDYQAAVFDMYPTLLRNTFLWPTLGNHDGFSASSDSESGAYYDVFTLPRQGEAGGLPSGTEAYYSFDHGDIHFICLDSHGSDRSPFGAMMTWLRADLANTKARWIIAYWHHPPYSKGSHDSDNINDSFGKLVQMRQFALPILEAGGVDLVLSGHSHSYERSYLLDGHYGMSSTLNPAMMVDRGDGRTPGDGAYAKPTAGPAAHEGAVYVVSGSSGMVSGGRLDHPAMVVSLASLGSLVLDVTRDRLDGRFLDHRGNVRDSFTLLKGAKRMLTRDEPEVSLSTGGTQTLFLDAGPENAGKAYLVGGSFGTSPGFDFGAVHIPLNLDPWLEVSLHLSNSSVYHNTRGVLDAHGKARAEFRVPALNEPALVGQAVYHAFVVYDSSQVTTASNPVKLSLHR